MYDNFDKDVYDNFDKYSLSIRIKELRIKRKKQYEESMREPESPFQQFSFCKTQALLAQKMKVERRTIIGWENGTSIPSVENLVKLASILKCNIDYFFGANDYPDASSTVALASHFSGISPEIIQYGLNHPDYLDCLNFFMHPDNCSSLFNNITLSVWRKFWIDASLPKITNSFKKEILAAYNSYSAIYPIQDINKKTYIDFLKQRFPEERLIFSKKKKENKIGFVIEPIVYKNFFEGKKFLYNKFIQYLADTTFEPLKNNALIESQKMRLAKAFIDLFTKYLKEED